MGNDFQTTDFTVTTDSRTINVSQALLYIVEIDSRMAEASGVDLPTASCAATYTAGIARVIRDLGLSGRAYIQASAGKYYLILKGASNQRPVLRGTRYLESNPKVAHITMSARSLARSAARMTGITVIAYTTLNAVEALFRQEDARLSSLIGAIAADVCKLFIAAGAGILAGALVGTITTLAVGPLLVALVVGVGTTIVLDRIDREFGLSEKLVRALERAADGAQAPFDELAREAARWERGFINQLREHSLRRALR